MQIYKKHPTYLHFRPPFNIFCLKSYHPEPPSPDRLRSRLYKHRLSPIVSRELRNLQRGHVLCLILEELRGQDRWYMVQMVHKENRNVPFVPCTTCTTKVVYLIIV